MENTNFTINYKLEKSDYYEFNKWYNKKYLKIVIIVFIVIFLFQNILEFKNLLNKDFSGLIINSIIFVLIFLAYFLFMKIYINIRSNKIFNQDKLLQCEIQLLINNEFIEEKTDLSNLKMQWNDINTIIFREKYIYIMITNIKGFIIPLKFIDNTELLDFLHSKISTTNTQ